MHLSERTEYFFQAVVDPWSYLLDYGSTEQTPMRLLPSLRQLMDGESAAWSDIERLPVPSHLHVCAANGEKRNRNL
jgi:hypothetical protein